jgi:transcriptional regulator with XRE-family HTH domain
MSTEFALDLHLARRKAGLTQRDAALLLGVHQSRVSALERGRALPTLQQICSLSLIFGRSFEALFAQIMDSTKQGISQRMTVLPNTVRSYVGTFNREASLQKLERRLQAQPDAYGA